MINLKNDNETNNNEEKIEEVLIPSIKAVKDMADIACRHNCEATLVSGRYAVDAKSIMGIFSLDVSKPLELHLIASANKPDDRDSFLEQIKDYIVIK